MGEIEHPMKSYPPSKAERQILLGAQPWSLTGRENTVVPLWWILPEIQPLRDWESCSQEGISLGTLIHSLTKPPGEAWVPGIGTDCWVPLAAIHCRRWVREKLPALQEPGTWEATLTAGGTKKENLHS